MAIHILLMNNKPKQAQLPVAEYTLLKYYYLICESENRKIKWIVRLMLTYRVQCEGFHDPNWGL